MYYFINKKTREPVIAIDDIGFIGSKYFLLLLELKQKFIMKQEYYDLRKTKKFLEMYISCNHKNRKVL